MGQTLHIFVGHYFGISYQAQQYLANQLMNLKPTQSNLQIMTVVYVVLFICFFSLVNVFIFVSCFLLAFARIVPT